MGATLITIILCIINIVICKKVFKSYFSPSSVYSSAWLITSTSYSIVQYFYGAYIVSLRVYIMIWISLITMQIASLMLWRLNKGKLNLTYDHTYNIRETALYLANIIAVGVTIPYSIKAIAVIKEFGWVALRDPVIRESLMGYSGLLKQLTTSYYVLPIFTVTIIFSLDLLIKGEKNSTLLKVSIFNILLYTITFGGRWLIIKTILYMFFLFVFRSEPKKHRVHKNTKNNKYKIIIVGIMSVAALIYITIYRSFSQGFVYTIFVYISGSMKYLDFALNRVISDGSFTFGTTLIAGIVEIPLILLQQLLNIDFLRPSEIHFLYNSATEFIGPNLQYNGFASILLSMFLDFRYFGPIIDMLVISIFYHVIYTKNIRLNTMRSRSLYAYFIVILAFSSIYWDGIQVSTYMTGAMIILFTRKKTIILDKGREILDGK